VDGVQPLVTEQSPDQPGLEDEVHSRVELLPDEALPGALPPDEALLLDAAQSLDEARLPDVERFLTEACFHAELRSPPDEACSLDEADLPSQMRSADETRHCAVLECCARQWREAERCSLDERLAYWPLAELRHDWLEGYKALPPVWPVRLHDR
jgi:hypothetical protein